MWLARELWPSRPVHLQDKLSGCRASYYLSGQVRSRVPTQSVAAQGASRVNMTAASCGDRTSISIGTDRAGQVTKMPTASDQHQALTASGQQRDYVAATGRVVQRPLPGHPVRRIAVRPSGSPGKASAFTGLTGSCPGVWAPANRLPPHRPRRTRHRRRDPGEFPCRGR